MDMGMLRAAACAGSALLVSLMMVTAPAGAAPPTVCHGLVATIVGTDGGDTLTGTSGDDVIVALGGDDTIDALGGDDVICAGSGDDDIAGDYSGVQRVEAGSGHDQIVVGRLATIDGGSGNDRITYGDQVDGGPGADEIQQVTTALGGLGNDFIREAQYAFGGDGDDVIVDPMAEAHGGEGNDVLSFIWNDDPTSGAYLMAGDAGNDTIRHRHATVALGGDGNDSIQANGTIDGGAGDDVMRPNSWTLSPRSGGADITGGLGNDDITGAPFGVVSGDAGNDTIRSGGQVDGGAGNDTIVLTGALPTRASGGIGSDVMRGDKGNEVVYGGPGADHLSGFRGDDQVYGGDGPDRLWGGPGDDRLNGGPGRDRCVGGPGRDRLTLCEAGES